MYSIGIFYFTFNFLGGAYAPNAPPLPTGLVFQVNMVGDPSWFSASTSRRNITAARGGQLRPRAQQARA